MSSPKVLQRRTQFAPCVAYLSPVKSWSVYAAPEIVSSARIEMTASVFMTSASISIVAKNGRARRIFGTNAGELRGRRGGHFDRSTARKAISVLGRRYAEMPQERSSHAFVVAETGTFGDLHDPADLPAFKQQPRGFHA